MLTQLQFNAWKKMLESIKLQAAVFPILGDAKDIINLNCKALLTAF